MREKETEEQRLSDKKKEVERLRDKEKEGERGRDKRERGIDIFCFTQKSSKKGCKKTVYES